AMDTLILQGKITYVGSSNFAGWHIARANEAAGRLHTLGLVSEQSHYNLLVRTVELEGLPACREYGAGVSPRSPLSGGWLAGDRRGRPAPRRAGRRVTNGPSPQAAQARSLAAAVRAPSGGSRPTWRFLIGDGPGGRAQLGPISRECMELLCAGPYAPGIAAA